eukprot:scaffold167459_cov70-Attheya_sp.AAC.5
MSKVLQLCLFKGNIHEGKYMCLNPCQIPVPLKDGYCTEKSTGTPTTTDKISLTFTSTPLQY